MNLDAAPSRAEPAPHRARRVASARCAWRFES